MIVFFSYFQLAHCGRDGNRQYASTLLTQVKVLQCVSATVHECESCLSVSVCKLPGAWVHFYAALVIASHVFWLLKKIGINTSIHHQMITILHQ